MSDTLFSHVFIRSFSLIKCVLSLELAIFF